jgi:hypothetical protein
MIHQDQEIYDVEQRIALRRSQVVRHSKEAGRRAMQGLASPAALIGAATLGFLVAAAVAKRQQKPPHPERRKSDHTKAAKATGLAGMLLPVAMWLVRAQWGSPVQAAQVLLERFQKRKPRELPKRPGVSPRADMTRP